MKAKPFLIRISILSIILILLSILSIVKCSDDYSMMESANTNVEAFINMEEGGFIELNDTNHLIIPPNSLAGDVNVGMTKTNQLPEELPGNLVALSDGIELTPEGTNFSIYEPPRLTLSYSKKDLEEMGIDERSIAIYNYNPDTGTYDEMGGTINTDNNTISAEIFHFSYWIILAQKNKDYKKVTKMPTISNVNFSPNPPIIGEPFKLIFRVEDKDESVVYDPNNSLVKVQVKWDVNGGSYNYVNSADIFPLRNEYFCVSFDGSEITKTNDELNLEIESVDNMNYKDTRYYTMKSNFKKIKTNSFEIVPASPRPIRLTSGYQMNFRVRALISGTATYTYLYPSCWSQRYRKNSSSAWIDGEFGDIDISTSGTMFTAKRCVQGEITPKFNNYTSSDSLPINVDAGRVTRIEILAEGSTETNYHIIKELKIAYGDTYQFDALGFDDAGNPIPIYPEWIDSGDIGKVEDHEPYIGLFDTTKDVVITPTGNTPIDATVSIALGALEAHVDIQVVGCPTSAPKNVKASDSYADKVVITWNDVLSSDEYMVYSSTESDGTYTQIGTSTTNSFEDTTAQQGITYYYKVSAYKDDCTETALSDYDEGNLYLYKTKLLGTPREEHSFGIVVDSNGNVFTTGYTTGDFISQTFTGQLDAFISKYDNDLNELWVKRIGTDSFEEARDIAIDSSGNIYITGRTGGDLYIPNTGNAIFTGKYDTDGNKIWGTQLNVSNNCASHGIALDSSGNTYVTGYSSANINTQENIKADAFIIKYDINGNILWSKMLGASNYGYAYDIALDSSGNAYITGYTYGEINGEPHNGSSDIFISKYLSDGTYEWTKLLETILEEKAFGITIDNSGNIYITVEKCNSYGFITKCDSIGNPLWSKSIASNARSKGSYVDFDSSGNLYIVGETVGNLEGQRNFGAHDAFIKKCDTNGDSIWTKLLGSSGSEYCNGIAFDNNNNAFITGHTNDYLYGEINKGDYDTYIIKVENN